MNFFKYIPFLNNKVKDLEKQIEIKNKQIRELNSDIERLSNDKKEVITHNNMMRKQFEEKQLEIKNADTKLKELNTLLKIKEDFFIKGQLQAIDSMKGTDFEYYCSDLLKEVGYEDTKVTKASGDGGVDIIAKKDNIKYVFQCKRFENNVGHKAVQEIYTALALNEADKAIVITNNKYFTKQAIDEARKLNIELWNRDTLENLIRFSYKLIIEMQIINPYTEIIKKLHPMFIQVTDYAFELGEVDTPTLMRKFMLNISDASLIIEQMVELGVCCDYEGPKPRRLIISIDEWNKIKEKL